MSKDVKYINIIFFYGVLKTVTFFSYVLAYFAYVLVKMAYLCANWS